MTKIYLVRHGETAWNREKVFRGRIDLELSERGKEEAKALAEELKKEPIKFIYSSPLKRALQTAQPLAEALGLEVKKEPGLIDLDFGSWQGKSLKEVKESDPENYRLWENSPEKLKFPQGESLAEARLRAMQALERIAQAHSDQCGVVVSHRVICKLILLSALGSSEAHFWKIQQDLACYNILERNEKGWVVRLVNHTCHLKNISGHLQIDF